MDHLWIFTTVLLLPKYECPKLGNVLMSPRLALNIYNKTNHWWMNPDPWERTLRQRQVQRNKSENLKVVVNSYDMGITVLAVAEVIYNQEKFYHLDPTLAYYHTSAYRWILRQLSLYPDLLYGKFFETRKVWRRRFYHEDALVPEWMRDMLAWVEKDTWDKEEDTLNSYNRYGKPVFDRYARYPPIQFDSNPESFSNSSSTFYPGPPD